MAASHSLSFTELDNILTSTVSSQASFYRQAQTDGPMLSPFDHEPVPNQLRSFVSFLRAGDCLVAGLQALPDTTETRSALVQLSTAMLGFAGRGVMYARPDQVVSEAKGVEIVKAMTGYDPSAPGLLTELMLDKMMGIQSTNQYMFAPISKIVEALLNAGETSSVVTFFQKLSTVSDDNDLACVVGNMSHMYMERFTAGDQPAGALAYALHQQDNAIMGSRLDVSMQDYLGTGAAITAPRIG